MKDTPHTHTKVTQILKVSIVPRERKEVTTKNIMTFHVKIDIIFIYIYKKKGTEGIFIYLFVFISSKLFLFDSKDKLFNEIENK